MAAAETARLIASLELQDKFSGTAQKAEGQLAGLERSTTRAGGGFLGLGTKMGSAGGAASKFGGALSHAKGAVGGLLSGPLGILGLGAGIGSLSILLTDSFKKAEEFGLGIQKLQSVTNLSTETTSGLLDTLDKFGISADKQVTIFGRLEKNIGALTVTQKKATEFQKAYGLSLTDAKGRAVDANEALIRVADFYNSNATATQKATVLNKLFGKSWTDLIPILKLGGEGIRAEERDALHLTTSQLANIAKFKTAQRDFQDALGDVQTMVGVELLPMLTGGLKALGTWLDTHRNDIVSFFKGAAETAGRAAQTIGQVFGTLKSAWESIPPAFRDLLVKGIVADRTVKFLFGFSPISFAGDLFKNLGGSLFSRGGSPFNPLFVQQVGVPGAPGIPGAPGVPPVIPVTLIAVAAAGVVKQIIDANDFRNQRAAIETTHPTLTNAEALALQLEKRGGLSSLDRRSAEGAITAFRNEATSYADALASAHKKLKDDAADLVAANRALRGDAKDTGRRDQLAPDKLRAAVKEGNRDVAARHDIGDLKLSVGLGLRQLESGLTRVESAGLREVHGAIGILQGAITGALGGGFGSVVSAIQGIRLPTFLPPTSPTRPRNNPNADLNPPPADPRNSRGGFNFNIKVAPSYRDTTTASVTHARMGPTPAEAGAQ